MASGGSSGLRFGISAAIGCVAVAVMLSASGILSSGNHHPVSSSGEAPATTAVTTPTVDPVPTPEAEAEPADAVPEASPEVQSPDPAPTATPPALVPTDALPVEVAQALTDMATQLQQVGDDGRPQELTREEVDALADEMLRAFGIEL